ncbi:hypothetical protein P9A54_gp82 [Xanthomonas phage vB_Xar_IVIA-DoCa10]|uniref:Uncharacterized protein n=1 Tax=Xanthomonas phage vB_Xar_IVIA-DoCa10 TaxID=2975529 RepID=A0A9X9NZ52_9CAUD|nr:hypothetical protein P9A54_gp82 [Xanthomonas phage vB_Xar_IVIA-DoCa10]UYA99067.1 hypothetical protein IVIADoCa10_82 [Xanthomonas phage vB_Xar_IVIA-DoCa10]
MNATCVQQLGNILAANARVLGMQAENQQRAVQGESMAYTAQDFNVEADQMEAAAREVANWGHLP